MLSDDTFKALFESQNFYGVDDKSKLITITFKNSNILDQVTKKLLQTKCKVEKKDNNLIIMNLINVSPKIVACIISKAKIKTEKHSASDGEQANEFKQIPIQKQELDFGQLMA